MTDLRLTCPPRFDAESGDTLFKKIKASKPERNCTVHLDFSECKEMDSLGGAWLIEISHYLRRRHAAIDWTNAEGQVAEFIEIVRPSLTAPSTVSKQESSSLEHIGGKAIEWWGEAREFLELIIDAFYWILIAPFEGLGFRVNLLIDEIYEMGVRAIRIVCLMNFLLGLIIAMLSSAQVESFGLTIYVADLMMIGFARELAAIMTAVVVSARTGAAIAAELATMKVQEEIDALRGMGLNVAQFLIAPKVLALVIVLPCLVVLGTLSGLAGGTLWGVFILEFRPSTWITQTINAAELGDLMQGFLKTLCFAVIIALIGCHNGLRVTGGSRGVGLMTTRAVVMDIFMIIVVDIVFATIFYYIL